jgi:PAS domain S-box-containing protein
LNPEQDEHSAIHDALMAIPAGITFVDLEEKIELANQAFADLIGYEVSELIGTNLKDFMAEEEVDKIVSQTKLREKGVSSVYETEIYHKNGSTRIVRVSASPRVGNDGKVIGSIGVITDITNEKFNEAALRESERRLELALTGADLGVWDWNLVSDKMTYNERWADMLGYSQEEIQETPDFFESLIHPADYDRVLKDWELHETGKTELYESRFRMKTKNGSYRWILDRGKIVERDEDGNPLRASGTHLDITSQMKAEQLRAQYQRELEIYSSIIRHDLANDLMILFGQIEKLQNMCNEKNGDTKETLTSASVIANRMANLLKAISKPPEEVETRVVELIGRLAGETQNQNPKMTINVHYEPQVKEIEVKVGRLFPAIFENLFRNAITFGGEKVIVDVTIRKIGNNIEIQITDNGPGISKDIQDKIFMRGVTTRKEGHGHGLYLSKQILEAIGGKIEAVDSTKSSGASFLMTFPLDS